MNEKVDIVRLFIWKPVFTKDVLIQSKLRARSRVVSPVTNLSIEQHQSIEQLSADIIVGGQL